MNAGDIAQMVSGAGAAVAAIAALLSVRHAAEVQRRSRWPHLTAMPRFDGATRRMSLEVHNAGLGIATDVHFAAVVDDHISEGTVGSTFLKPDTSILLCTCLEMTTEQEQTGVRPLGALWCADTARATHVFSFKGEGSYWPPRPNKLSRIRQAPEECLDILAIVNPDWRPHSELVDRAYACRLNGKVAVFKPEHQPFKDELARDLSKFGDI